MKSNKIIIFFLSVVLGLLCILAWIWTRKTSWEVMLCGHQPVILSNLLIIFMVGHVILNRHWMEYIVTSVPI